MFDKVPNTSLDVISNRERRPFNPMGLFGAAKGWDRAKSLFPCLKSDTHIPQ